MSGGRPSLEELVASRPVVVCCGPGGVGKTTVSASVALEAARQGRRACVVTVDPARRLASSLGVDSLPNTPTPVEGPWPGELHALMLDTKGTFDALVHRYAESDEQAEAIVGNRLYASLASVLSGTQEYMAMEKLYELTEEGGFDVVVVDTPPTRNALELLDAPSRLTHFLENRVFRALLVPTKAYLRAVGVAARAVLRTISKVAGAEIVDDAVTFFQAFGSMEEGFRSRASSVHELLLEPSTAYVVVTSPREDAVEEASYFTTKLAESGVEPSALVLNRVHPRFARPGTVLPEAVPGTRLAVLEENLRQLDGLAEDEDGALAPLVDQAPSAALARVPLFEEDVHDVTGLGAVADHLFSLH